MSESKMSLLDKKIAKFAESTTELITDIHSKKKVAAKGASKKKRRMKKTISRSGLDTDLADKKA